MNINDYLKKYKDVTFEELEFNELDSLILSELSYMNLNLYVPRLCDNKFIALKDIEIVDSKAFSYGSVDYKNNLKMFDLMRSGERFQNMQAGLFKECLVTKDSERAKQFFAVTFLLPNNTLYLSFRGTDITINGWKEDFHLCLMDTIPSQDEALRYTKNVLRKYKYPFYLGGHSKGGNLAFYSAINLSSKRLEKRLIKAYSFDGPGFKNGIKNFPSYNEVKNKLVKYMTHRDLVGMIYNNFKKGAIIISATGILLGGHDPFSWRVNISKARFIRSRRSKVYINGELAFNKWLDSLKDEDKVLACDMIFEALKEAKTVYDLPKAIGYTIVHGKEFADSYSDEDKERVKEIVKKLIKIYFEINFKPKKKPKKIEKQV